MYKQILERKNVLVAGGAGFIGSHLCDELIKHANVICVDNFITGSEENIDLLLQQPNFKFLRHDLREPLDLEKFNELEVFKIKFQGVQEIYNLACPTSPKHYNNLPIETLLTNSQATYNLLELAVQYKAKFLHASSSAIYGEPPADNKSITEDYWGYIDPVGPRSCYNEGKRFAESLVVNYSQHRGVSTRIARIFNTYGPRMKLNDGRMIPDFIAHAISGRAVVIYGDRAAASTYCYISDMVDGLVKLMDFDSGGIFNLGSLDQKTIAEIAALAIKLTGAKVGIEVAASLPYLSRQGLPDITRAKELLGWFPLVALEVGLQKTVDYFLAHQNVLALDNK